MCKEDRMERKRKRLRLSSSSDDEEKEREEDRARTPCLRSTKRPTYTEEDDEDEEHQDEVEEEGEDDTEQPGPSTQNNHTQKRFLKVTCGNKTGHLDKDKLYQAVKCIRSGDSWFYPSAFEELGGKGASKKWKTSILHDKKPLKFWIEQGVLTTQRFNKRGTETTKKMKIRSSNRISESSSEESEIQSAEESEEDDVKDEDWCPGSEELVLETEEERVELGDNGEVVDSGVDENKEEEDEVEKGEMEDEDMPAVEGNDNSDVEGWEAKSRISTPLREVKVVIRRLPEFQVQTNGLTEYPLKDSEDAQNEDERARDGSPLDDVSVTASAHLDRSHVSDTSAIGADENESQEDFTEDSEREEDERREIKTESSPTLSAPAAMSQHIKPEAKHIGSVRSDHTASLCASPVLVVTVTDTHLVDIKGDWEESHCKEMEEDEEGKQTEMVPALFDCEDSSDEHLDMPGSDAAATGKIRDTTSPQTFIKEEISAAMDYDPPTTPPSLLVECKYETTDATTSGRDAAELQVMLLETGVPQTSQASDAAPSPDIVEAQSSGRSTSCDLDTMDLDQLRREKIKLQIRVLRLQEEYYTQKIKEQKK